MHLAKMAEDSFEVQTARWCGKKVAISVRSISPHGSVQRGKEYTAMCMNIIDSAVGNIKAGQYAVAPTFMKLRPVAAGYPESWSVRTGVLWTTAFGM